MTNKLKYFIGNWKMFGDFSSFNIVAKINKFYKKNKKLNKSKIILCVPSTIINHFQKKLKSNGIFLGAQNCHHNKGYGSFTGSINSKMLKNAGAKYIILGHSENRFNGDTNHLIKQKIISALDEKLTVIFCIGESFKDKKDKKTFSVIRNQLKGSLLKSLNLNKIIFAYEPIWSIGTNKIPNDEELKKTVSFIKNEVKNFFKSKKTSIVLYGGSVNPNNISQFSKIPEIDGFLIGGASQSSKKFIDIIKNYYK
jgi:triosephosphate isomerase (TIM)